MRFMHRHRRLVSSVSVLVFLLAGSVTPASAIYNPKTGKWMQRDPNGLGVVLQPSLSYNAANPVVTVSVAYELQYADGMNFYDYLRSNPVNATDPSGLTSLLQAAWQRALSNWSEYLRTYSGRAWSQRIEGVQSAEDIFGEPNSDYDADIFEVIESLQNDKVAALQQLESASFQLRYGHKLSGQYAGGGFAWDEFVWERDEAILMSLTIGGLFARACFVEGTEVLLADGRTESIEDVEIGTRVATSPADPGAEIPGTMIDPDSWRLIRLEAEDAERGTIHINLLRPARWVAAIGAGVDGSIYVSVPEIGIQGLTTVSSIEPCPESIEGPAAGIVTGTFATERAHTVNVYLEAIDDPIGATREHPLYSIDRNRWVGAGSLRPGERVRTDEGDVRVEGVKLRADAEIVYNLEVHGTHTYFASTARVWAHNACSANEVRQLIRRGKAPRTIRHVNTGRIAYEKTHLHFTDGTALNIDGTWKHGRRVLTNAEKAFIRLIEWVLPGN